MTDTNLPAEGHIGIAAPGDAPMETSQPLTAEYLREAQAKASQNERTLAPLTYGKGPTQTGPMDTQVPGVVREPEPVKAAPGYQTFTPKSEFPAASEGESPSRGLPGTAPIPAARTRPPLGVTGGFGETEAEYFPINGQELRALVETLMDALHNDIQTDLRFHIAATYPRLSVKVQLVVEAEADDAGLMITKVIPPIERMPLSVAEEHYDSVCFVVKKHAREFNEQGEVESQPDAMRDAVGLPKPFKRRVGGPTGQMVDVTW